MDARAPVRTRAAEAAFAEQFAAFTPTLRAWVRRHRGVAGVAVDVEDIAQEVWLRALTGRRGHEAPVANIRPWLLGIAARVLLELRRGSLRMAPVAEGGTKALQRLDELPTSATTVLTSVARRERLQRVVDCIRQRDETDSRVFELRAIEGRSHTAVAAMIGISVEAAMKRWQRLLAVVRGTSQLRRLLLG